MVKVIKNTAVYYNGDTAHLIAGTEYKKDAKIVLANPKAFTKVEKVMNKKVETKVKPEVKTPEVKEKLEDLKEELLIEDPIEVQTEIIDEPVTDTEEKPKTRRRRK